MAKNPPIMVTREQERRAWQMVQKGRSQISIAEELGISPATVCRMIKRVNAGLAKHFTENALSIKAEQTAQLEQIAGEAIRLWQESEGDVTVRREAVAYEPVRGENGQPKELHGPGGEVVIGENGQPVIEQIVVSVTTSTETRRQFPEPRYLGEARAALADIRKIWGLDASREDSAIIVLPKAYINIDIEAV